MSRVAVTGMGIVSSIGMSVDENYQSLISKRNGITRVDNIQTILRESIKVGEIKQTNEELSQRLGLDQDNNYSRTAILGELAAIEAVNQSGGIDDPQKTGIISSTSVAGMDKTEQHYYEIFEDDSLVKYAFCHPAGDSTNKIANRLGIKGFTSTISTACSSGANAIMLGARMIKSGQLDQVVVGGTDCLSKFTMNGFNSLMILSNNDCTPFDKDRKGLNLGEAAAYLVLESEESAKANNKEILAYVVGYGNANDAHHQTASSENGDGATLAMEKALKVAQIQPEAIDYVNAHGTATENNDASESKALLRIFGSQVPDFSSTKAYTGHTLAAAGAIEAVYSILAINNNQIFPNLNFKDPIEDSGLVPVTEVKGKEINFVLSNSFGFGGNCSSVIFQKAK